MKTSYVPYLILLGLTAMISHHSYAQEQDPEAGKLLDKLVRETRNTTGFESAFYFTVIDLKEESESSFEGRFFLKADKYIVKTETMEVYFDGTTLWNYLSDVNEVNISHPGDSYQEEQFFDNPIRLFSIYKDDFFYTFIGEDIRDSKPVNIVDLYPRNLDTGFSRIRLILEKDNAMLYSAQIFGKDGVHYVLKISGLKTNPLEDAVFRFDVSKHPGIEVIDLR